MPVRYPEGAFENAGGIPSIFEHKTPQGGGMKKVLWTVAVLVMMILPVSVWAQGGLEEAKAYLEKDLTLADYQKAIDLCAPVADSQPQSFEANWMTAKAYRLYADEAKKQQVDGWKDICKEYGKKGMNYAEKAIALAPDRVEGHFWYGTCVGSYSDGVSILTALKEGLKDKTQTSFETASSLDKTYYEGGPVLAIGRFWSVLPWPMKDKKKALEYLEEFHAMHPDNPEGLLYLGEAYLDSKEKAKAKDVLSKAAASDKKFFSDQAKKLLESL
jgi:tetratricopeptide (TPR) repeat protein